IMVGSGRGAENGILIKNAESLERAHKITTIVFDKTGTITKGSPEVVNILGNNDVLEIAYALEKNSEHPLAQAVINEAEKKKLTLKKVSDFKSVTGRGIKASIDSNTYLLGNLPFLNDNSITLSNNQEAEITKAESMGQTALILAGKNEYLGVILVADQIKETSKKAIEKLKDMNVKTIMLTGDNELTAQAITKEVGIDQVYARLMPDQKVEKIKELQKKSEVVAMVGDGINDAPALTQADVGLAIGTGTDIAIESANITLVHGDLLKVAEAIKLSKKTVQNIKQNLFWAFFYNTIGIPLAAFGLFAPIFAAVAMSFSSISVVLNSLRLKKIKL
ncbi:heavy metal translocating P-type ATPase, partial [bacterium]|nr:heavy metal translocating P-type ATPase [bacterium]